MNHPVVVITGAASGIGLALAAECVSQGLAVMMVDRNEEILMQQANQLRAVASATVHAEVCDVSSEVQMLQLAKTAFATFGHVDVLINNAGVSGRFGSFIDLPLHEWQHMINANLTSVFLCLKYELGVMAAQGSGAIVNVSSGAGVVAAPGLPHYTAAKHGVLGLTKCAAQEFAAKGVRVNAILPGTTRTPMIEGFINGDPKIEKMVSRGIGRGYLGEPSEIAEAAVWLCSDRASFVCG